MYWISSIITGQGIYGITDSSDMKEEFYSRSTLEYIADRVDIFGYTIRPDGTVGCRSFSTVQDIVEYLNRCSLRAKMMGKPQGYFHYNYLRSGNNRGMIEITFNSQPTITESDAVDFFECYHGKNDYYVSGDRELIVDDSYLSLKTQISGTDIGFKMPSCVEVIGESCFAYCMFQYIELPSSIKQIDAFAFAGCTRLKNLNLPNTLTRIGAFAFLGCTDLYLNTYTSCFPDSLEVIERCAFMNSGVTLVHFSSKSNLISIEEDAFYGSSVGDVALPDSLTVISSGVFENCEYLHKLTLSDEVTGIGAYAFGDCSDLCGTCGRASSDISDFDEGNCLTLPRNLESIDVGAFEYTKIESLVFGDCLISIDDNAFKGTDLVDVVLPSTLTYLGGFVFEGCSLLRRLKLPSSIIAVSDAFLYGVSLRVLDMSECVAVRNIAFLRANLKVSELLLPPLEEVWGKLDDLARQIVHEVLCKTVYVANMEQCNKLTRAVIDQFPPEVNDLSRSDISVKLYCDCEYYGV